MPIDTISSSTPPPKLSDVFNALREEAHNVAAVGRALYGAQAKTHLKRIYPDFSENSYGFRKFIELLEAGDDAGAFTLEIVDGHPRITDQSGTKSHRRHDLRRLKPDLWDCLVTWDSGLRYWDRNRRRAIFIPTGDSGSPAWETSPESFVAIRAITMDEQIAWMHSFAAAQEEPVRTTLVSALNDPKQGAFKKALDQARLAGAWRRYLHQRVLDHATDWAAQNELPVSTILEPRDHSNDTSAAPTRDPSVSTTVSRSKHFGNGRGNTSTVEINVDAPAVAGVSNTRSGPVTRPQVDELRSLLHEVIDEMSFSELAVLPIPAAYLIRR